MAFFSNPRQSLGDKPEAVLFQRSVVQFQLGKGTIQGVPSAGALADGIKGAFYAGRAGIGNEPVVFHHAWHNSGKGGNQIRMRLQGCVNLRGEFS